MSSPRTKRLTRHIRQVGAGARLLRANMQRLDSPVKVNLCVTYWCQYQCQTCNIWKRKPTDELTTEELLFFIKQNPDIAWLDITGGEIFLRDDIGQLLEAIARTWTRLAVLHFPTNGFLTDQIVRVTERIAGLTPAQVVVTVSLDGDEQLNDKVRGIRGGYQRQIDTFNALRRIPGVRVVLGMTLSRYNVGQVKKTFRACQRDCPGLTIHDFHLNVAQLSGHYYGNDGSEAMLASPAAIKDTLHEHRAAIGRPTSVAAWVEHTYLKHLDTFLETGHTPMRCHALRSSCFVDPWGVVFPCISYSRPVGRLRECDMKLATVWRDAAAVETQAEIWEGQCPQCWTPCEAYQSILGNIVRPRVWLAQENT